MKDLKIRVEPVPMARAKLIPITTVIQAVSEQTDGEASIAELVDALHRCYNYEAWMMYRGSGYGLADAIDGNPLNEFGGYNDRRYVTDALFNSCYWRDSGVTIKHGALDYSPDDFLMKKDNMWALAGTLWKFLELDDRFNEDKFSTLIHEPINPRYNRSLKVEILASQPKLEKTPLEKSLGTVERNILLTIIAALCNEAKLDYTKHAKTAGMIQSTAAGMGLSIGESTIEGHLKKIPNALAGRMK